LPMMPPERVAHLGRCSLPSPSVDCTRRAVCRYAMPSRGGGRRSYQQAAAFITYQSKPAVFALEQNTPGTLSDRAAP
jgi:hypothetical protein